MCSPVAGAVHLGARRREPDRARRRAPRPPARHRGRARRRSGPRGGRRPARPSRRCAAPRAGRARPRRRCAARRSSASRYSGKVSQSHVRPSASAVPGMSSTPSSRPMSQSWRSGAAGAKPTPQLPIAIGGDAVQRRRRHDRVPGDLAVEVGVDVDEARRDDRAVGVDLPRCRAGDGADGGDDVVGDLDVAPRPGAPPVPSTIVPLRMIRSAISATPVQRRPLFGRTTRAIVSRFGGDGLRQ